MKRIKWIAFSILFSLLLTSPIQASANTAFSDVKKSDEAYKEIHYIANYDIISGYTENGQRLYKPQNNITRAQASKMLVIATGNENHNGNHIVLNDVEKGSEQEHYIRKAVSLGYFKIGSDGKFNPNEFVKRSELAVAISTAFKISEPVTKTKPLRFYDIQKNDVNAAYMNGLYYAGISQGDRGAFKSDHLLTRKHFALFVARAMDAQFKLEVTKPSNTIIGHGYVKIDGLNIRTEPSTSKGKVIGKFNKYDTFRVIGNHDNWIEIEYDHYPAFISKSNYIELVDSELNKLGPVTSVVQIKTGSDTLNVRSGPGVEHPKFGAFKHNEIVEVFGKKDGWYLVKMNGLPGYINASYTETVQDSTPSSPSTGKVMGKVTVASLNVRSGPNSQYPRLGALKHNQKVEVLSLEGYWAKINYNGLPGYVHKTYLKLLNQSNSPVQDRIIVIDAGHGGTDPGASGNGIVEKHLALDISKRVEAKLKRAGANVLMTRTGDTFPTLKDRTDFAKRHYAETFVSIHGNAFTPAANGTEVFYDTSTNPNGNESRQLAQYIQNNIVRMANMTDRGAKDTGFYVIRNNNVAAVLVELGFMTNKSDAEKLKRNPDIFAEAIYQGIVQYYSVD